jgi:hypothetical protein
MARLIVSDGTQQRTVELTDPVTSIGRSSENKIALDDKQCSRRHCQVERTDQGYKLVDLESRNGTRVNDRQVNQALLRPGDRIQVGRHVLTFEDPDFREPAPSPAAPAAAVPAPAPAPPVASVPAAAPPAEAPSRPPEPEKHLRRRTGHTTALTRVADLERAREQKLLTWVGIGAGVFLFILLVLVALPSGGSPVEAEGERLYKEGAAFYKQRELERARDVLRRVRPEHGGLYGQAQALLRQVEEDLRKRAAFVPATAEERREFDALYEFCEKNRANPVAFARMKEMCEEFRRKYPRSEFLPKVDEYLGVAASGLEASRFRGVAEALDRAQEELRRGDFGNALKQVKALLAQSLSLELRERAVKAKEEIEEKARQHFSDRRKEAEDLRSRGRKDEARRVYEALILIMGDGSVEELADYCVIARKSLEALQ